MEIHDILYGFADNELNQKDSIISYKKCTESNESNKGNMLLRLGSYFFI